MESVKTRVLVVDDSALVRELLKQIIPAVGDLEIVGTAPDPYIARAKIKQLNPDVLTLDVEMPRMDGITFLRNLMRLRPMPVVMISALTQKGAEQTLQALALGATDFVAKPTTAVADGLPQYGKEIRDKIRTAACSNIRGVHLSKISKPSPPAAAGIVAGDRVIGIGASAGGTEAIREVVGGLPADAPPVVICQHLPVMFTAAFARRLDRASALTVREARDAELLHPGYAYVAPGDRHLLVVRERGHLVCRLDDGALVNRQKPAVDVLFASLAEELGRRAIGVLLTGMGKDGAQGLLAMHLVGASTIAQDEATSLIWGMPGEAVRLRAADQELALSAIPGRIVQLLRSGEKDP